MKIICENETATYDLGVRLGLALKPGMVLSLNGDLGAGKTHLTKGIARGLDIEEYITSPSFTILNEYDGRIPMYHFDVYRIIELEEMYEVGFEEYLYGSGACIVEWGDMVEKLLPESAVHIYIKRLDGDMREITINDRGNALELEEITI